MEEEVKENMAVDFYKEEGGEPSTPVKVKLGDTEFTSQELEDLVGAGRKLKEIEEKQGQPVDDILRSWGRRGEVLGKYKKLTNTETPDELEASFRKPAQVQAQEPVGTVDEEAVKRQVISEAKKFGLLTKEEAQELFNQTYQQNRAGEKLLNKTARILREAKSEGKPSVELDKFLEFMADPANPKDPQKAYKIMFEKELDEWKEKNLSTLRKPGMVTDTAQPSIKTPQSNRPQSADALKTALQEALTRGG